MCTIIGSSRSNCVLIISFELYGCRAGLFEGDLLQEGNFNLSFCWIGNLSFYLNENELTKKMLVKSLGKGNDA